MVKVQINRPTACRTSNRSAVPGSKPYGKIRQWYSRGDGRGVVFLVDAKTEDEARALMETLPLAKENLTDHVYIPVGPLMPLRALMGAAQQ